MREEFDILRKGQMCLSTLAEPFPSNGNVTFPGGGVGLKFASFSFLGREHSWEFFFKPCTKHGIARLSYHIPGSIKRYTHTKHPLKI